MLKTFEDVQKQIARQVWKTVHVDDIIFRLHYRLTVWILMTATVLVSSRQYFGEHIRCISDTIAPQVMNTFCFFTTTFTVPRHRNASLVPHLGVGPQDAGDSVVHHSYYQWVPFVLTGQAILFYLPHLLWRTIEGGTVKLLVEGLEHGYLAIGDRDIGKVPSKAQYTRKVNVVRTTFLSRLRVNKWWGQWLVGCELLNAVNLVVQFVLTDSFLGGRFLNLGPSATSYNPEDGDPLDLIFPKVTKCTFFKYGQSGTIQAHDALCVMALNVINEKIYLFLWFWFVFLAVVTVLSLVWRALTVLLYSRYAFSQRLFDVRGRLEPNDVDVVMSNCDFSHWLFLYYLTNNMHITATSQLFKDLAAEMREQKGNGYSNRATLPMPARGGGLGDDDIPMKRMGEPRDVTEPLLATGEEPDASGRPHND